MCGIAGIFKLKGQDIDLEKVISLMSKKLIHRGPDYFEHWVDESSSLALSHRRLSIIDLSSSGNQPMHSECGRFVILFNGEIYNWKEIRKELDDSSKSPRWFSNSDTEVLLALISLYGFKEALLKCRGMFAIALWDKNEKTLILARDRIGEKPLYYSNVNGKFIFASELKSIKAIPNITLEIDKYSLSMMLRYGYIPAPNSIYKNVYKLPPGKLLVIKRGDSFHKPITWWDFSEKIINQSEPSFDLKEDEIIENLDIILSSAVKEQMIADVPVGVLLSGGIDSSLITFLMQKHSSKPINSFTVSFEEKEYNEANYAKNISKFLGTNHNDLRVQPEDALDIIPNLPEFYDEPFGDSSQIPTSLICKLTRQHVKVCLTGDAGDEFFGGYNRYFWVNLIWKHFGWIPVSFRSPLFKVLKFIPAVYWNKILNLNINNIGDKIHKFSEVISAKNKTNLYHNLITQWRENLPLEGYEESFNNYFFENTIAHNKSFVERMMIMDTQTYLPDDILVKLDRAAMSSSLETRVPFLDERVMKFAWQIPLDQKINKGQGKIILKKFLQKFLPNEFVNRPKQGFAVPIEIWLRTCLRDWAEDLLSEKSLSESGMISFAPIRKLWSEHLNGVNHQSALWNVLMFQSWYKKNFNK